MEYPKVTYFAGGVGTDEKVPAHVHHSSSQHDRFLEGIPWIQFDMIFRQTPWAYSEMEARVMKKNAARIFGRTKIILYDSNILKIVDDPVTGTGHEILITDISPEFHDTIVKAGTVLLNIHVWFLDSETDEDFDKFFVLVKIMLNNSETIVQVDDIPLFVTSKPHEMCEWAKRNDPNRN